MVDFIMSIPLVVYAILMSFLIFLFFASLVLAIPYFNIDDLIDNKEGRIKEEEELFKKNIYKIKNEIDVEERSLANLKRKIPIYKSMVRVIFKILLGNRMAVSIYRYLIGSFVITGIVFTIIFITQGLLQALMLGSSTLLICVLYMNVVSFYKTLVDEKDIFQFMLINQGNYMNSPFITDALSKTKEALNEGTVTYSAVSQFLDRTLHLNMTTVDALEMMKQDLGGIETVNKLIDHIIKCETISQDYKMSLPSFSETFEIELKSKASFVLAVIIGFGGYAAQGLGITALSIRNSMMPQLTRAVEVMTVPRVLLYAAYIMFFIAGTAVFYVSLKSGRREWE